MVQDYIDNQKKYMKTQTLEDKMDKLTEEFEAFNDKANKVTLQNQIYFILMRVFSVVLFAAVIYAGILGFAASSLVLGTMFMVFWFIFVLGWTITQGIKQHKTGEYNNIKLEYDKSH